MMPAWTVTLHRHVEKQYQTLPQAVQDRFRLLIEDLETQGPVRGNWPNYSKLDATRHHCHLKKGRPTYVAVWAVTNARHRTIEVLYVGTYANAPY
jgi:mRNA-degrading endonuclease RelE of RelBE toxin-antitoxin system